MFNLLYWQWKFDYFRNLSSLGNHVYGTCTVVAIAMLFGYYDVFVHDDCVDDYYSLQPII